MSVQVRSRLLLKYNCKLRLKLRNILFTHRKYVLFAQRLILVRRDIVHAGNRSPRNLVIRLSQIRRDILYQLSDVDQRHTDRTNRPFITKKFIPGNPVDKSPDYRNFAKNLLNNLLIPVIHSTRTTFPG